MILLVEYTMKRIRCIFGFTYPKQTLVRKYCSIIAACCLFVLIQPLHAQFTDSFEDGDFTSNPEWTGYTDNFQVEGEMLRLVAPAEADQSYLVTTSESIENATWEFWLRMDFNPSGANYADIYLVSNQSNLKLPLNGYFVRVGNTADEVSLYRQDGSSQTEIIDGPDGFVDMSQVIVRVRATRDDSGNWTLEADNTGGTDFQLMGNAADDTYIQSYFFGVLCTYTSTRSDLFYYDDFNVSGDPFVDDIPPTIESLEVISSTELRLLFSEPLDESSAENVNNYELQPFFGSPVSATLNSGNSAEVDLVFSNEMQNGNEYNLLVNGVEDLSGNVMDSDAISFLFVIPEEADFKDVVFNEIMADPNPPVNVLPDEEYLELYNPSAKYIDLGGWDFVNTTTIRELPTHILAPGDYVLLCHTDHVGLFEPYGEVIGISSFVALANAADSLTLIDSDGTIIDVVSYTDNWYGDPEKDGGGWSLELINPETECSGQQNWIASNDPSGGTPGAENSVYDNSPDVTPPALVDYSISNPQSVILFFSEPLDAASVSADNISVSPEIQVSEAALSADELSIQISLDQPLDTAVTYTVTVTGVTDCIGNEIAGENSVEFLIGYEPSLYEIIINELMADPTPEVGLPPQEYIELYNTSDKLFDISSCNISGSTFNPNTFIGPGEYLVLVSPGTAGLFDGIEGVVEMATMSSTFLTNSGRELMFVNAANERVDRVNYSIDWYRDQDKIDGGWSLERINPEEPCRAGDNWRASVNSNGGTPGFENSVLDLSPDDTAPVLNTILVNDSVNIELVFNEVLDSNSVITAGYEFEPELTVFDIQNVAPDYTRIRLTLSEPLDPNVKHEVLIVGLTDCTGNEYANDGQTTFGLPGEVTAGNLIINEILFNQRTGGSDFVEVYNNSDAIISLQNWQLGNLGNEQFRIITEEAYILFPGDYLAITDDRQNIITEYPLGPPLRIFEAGDIPTFNNSDGQVVLANASGETVDRFDYDEDYHFPLLQDVKGVSLERIDFDRPSDDETNWMSASESVGWATPGYENSQFQQSEEEGDEVWVSPEVFSPDNDGYQDVLNINYEFDQSGLAGKITIYDSAGRLVRQLIRNELLGTEGTISWDGTGDQGERARVGIHIVHVEVFTSEGYQKAYKLSCVVASRF